MGQEVPPDQEVLQNLVRLFHQPARPRQVPLSALHNLTENAIATAILLMFITHPCIFRRPSF